MSPYIPKARPVNVEPQFWEDLRKGVHADAAQLLERDVFYRAADAVGKLLAGQEGREEERGEKTVEATKLFEQMIADRTLASMPPFRRRVTNLNCFSDRLPVLVR
jgi:hypothetical protein